MTDSDDKILEFLEDTDLALPPRAVEYNLKTRYGQNVSYSTINRRFALLIGAGLIEKEYEDGGYYSITEKGRKYLDGELDAEEIEDIE